MNMVQEIIVGSPEASGIASRNIANYLNRLREMDYDLHSFQIYRDGRKVFGEAASLIRLRVLTGYCLRRKAS